MGKKLLTVVFVAVIVAVISHFVQLWLTGDSNPAISGGIAGAVSVPIMFKGSKKGS